jgi:hypothetical protein
MKWDEARKELLEEGFIEFGPFRVELTLDNTFMEIDHIPRVAVYWEVDGRWHVLRNPIPKGKTLDEGWTNAVDLLEAILRGEEWPRFNNEPLERAFVDAIRSSFQL